MDGLDIYIDDYSKPDPIDAETVAGLVQARYLFNPPRTRVNERGEAEDVPADEVPDRGRSGRAHPSGRRAAPPAPSAAGRRGRRCAEAAAPERCPPCERARDGAMSARRPARCSCARATARSRSTRRRSAARSTLPRRACRCATMLCQKQMRAFADGAHGDVLVACTQEARLFEELAQEGARTQAIRFVNLREAGGWSPEARGATPKLAALIAAASLPEPAPGRRGELRIEGPAADRRPARRRARWAKRPGAAARRHGPRDRARRRRVAAVRSGTFPIVDRRRSPALVGLARRVRGDVDAGQPDRPRPVHALPRVRARLSRGRDRRELPGRPRPLHVDHRECVTACGAIGAIDFDAAPSARATASFDLVLDLGRDAVVPHAPAAAGLLRARRRRRRAGEGAWPSSRR